MAYQKRKIAFYEILYIDGWSVKVYMISKEDEFKHMRLYEQVKLKIKEWLGFENGFNSKHHHMAFLILHAGDEGVFSIINWWVGENMLNSHVFLTKKPELCDFHKISGDGLTFCVWELAIVNHERQAWLDCFLLQSSEPQYSTYLKDTLNCII
ncbi:hypothetical protein [Aureibacter tunicatorum]|uniref:Uncharacterized protein n=1 Tax=Aureibacter tunicatorum TaxID=866807 RepID=A0AAE3XRK9_9BACT|nr:hypothetical protein [Aureibacter tunicatorum]MDR6240645.1 hypothetical protein [Aureibacter tunicatorum]BDD06494.1 hypothetical protein AUTU_39770 [Aureibacter tunicatorum]